MPPLTVLAILAIFLVLALVVSKVEGLALFAPKSTDRLGGTAQRFCRESCRHSDGSCPLWAGGLATEDCPLWKFVDAAMPTGGRIDPFQPARPAPGHGGVESGVRAHALGARPTPPAEALWRPWG